MMSKNIRDTLSLQKEFYINYIISFALIFFKNANGLSPFWIGKVYMGSYMYTSDPKRTQPPVLACISIITGRQKAVDYMI